MTRFIAFSGRPSLKADLIERVAAHAAAGTIDPRGARWTGTGGTPAGCIAADGDPKAFETATGYPAGLGPLLDILCASFEEPFQVATAATDWLAQVEPGADMSPVPSRIIGVMLGEGRASAALAEQAPRIAEALSQVLERHREVAAGTSIGKATWTEARMAAIEATDTAEDELARLCGAMAEAAAWDPLAARGLLVEVASRWKQARGLLASVATGWRKQDDAAVEACFDTFRAACAARGESPERTSFPPFFAAREPELSRRFVAQLTASNVAFLGADGDLMRESLGCLAAAGRRHQPNIDGGHAPAHGKVHR